MTAHAQADVDLSDIPEQLHELAVELDAAIDRDDKEEIRRLANGLNELAEVLFSATKP